MTIARDHGFEVRVDDLSRSDLYVAEEMFVCGTAAEVERGELGRRPRDSVPRPDDARSIADEYGKSRPRPGRQVQRMV